MTDEPLRDAPGEKPAADDPVDAASIDSFPASDPPPWTLGRRDRVPVKPLRRPSNVGRGEVPR